MSTDALTKTSHEPPQIGGEQPAQEQPTQQQDADKTREKIDAALEVLEPRSEPRKWIIGKPPEMGGDQDEYSIYFQKPLGYMPRLRFFSLVSQTISRALKEGATINIGDIDFSDGVPTREQLSAADFGDAAGFMALAFQLLAYSPDFLLDCYALWLNVPANEKRWAKMVMNQPWDPDQNMYGLKEDDGLEMIETFIDQNYEDTRDFFVNKLPRIAQRVREREAEHSVETKTAEETGRKSASVQ